MSNSYNNTGMVVNPILGTFPPDEINIQPYWLVVLQLLVSQLCQRIWHYVRYKTWFTTLEIAGLIRIFQNRLANKNATDRSVPVAFVDSTPIKSSNIQSPSDKKNRLFQFHFRITYYAVLKKQNTPRDAASKDLQLTKDNLVYSCTFCFQNGQNFE